MNLVSRMDFASNFGEVFGEDGKGKILTEAEVFLGPCYSLLFVITCLSDAWAFNILVAATWISCYLYLSSRRGREFLKSALSEAFA